MIGETILHYKILEKLGEGGMGEVYKAQDTKLDRFVALKFLPSNLTANEEQKARFIQEAKTSSAMNHPNICTIYDIQENNGQLFIVMEFVEGETLKNLVETHRDASLPEKQKLEISVQVAEGLAAAHEKGIVHRDIKPENIMIRKDGIAQIMDFGLAKLYSDKNVSRLTKVGTTMGTLGYMSPEQIQGLDVDHRSDIFSFGVVLYEMFAGESPFKGMHETAIMYEIVNVEAPPLSTVKQDIDPELERIILECLEKDKDERCQSAKELAKNLRKVKKSTGTRKSKIYNVDTAAGKTGTAEPQVSKTSGSFSVELLNHRFDLSKLFRLKYVPWIIALLLAAFIIYSQFGENSIESTTFTKFEQLTEQSGEELFPDISPDGNYITYTKSVNGFQHIFIQRIGGGNAIDLTKDSKVDNYQSAFSPDGQLIVFRSERDGGGLFLMGSTGESVRRLTNFGYNPSWSPDSKMIVFATEIVVHPYARNSISSLWNVDIGTGKTEKIYNGDAVQPSWSHNGRWIAFWGLPEGTGKRSIWVIKALGGTPLEITNDNYINWSPFWSANDKYLYFSSNRGGSMNLWKVKLNDHDEKISSEIEPVITPSLASVMAKMSLDGKKLIYVSQDTRANIYKISFNPVNETISGNPEAVTEGSKQFTFPSVSPDNKKLAAATFGQQEDIYIINTDGSGFTRLTNDIFKDRCPSWSSDGKHLVFFSDRSGKYEIWEIDIDGSNLKQLTQTNGIVSMPHWLPDGKAIIYSASSKENYASTFLLYLDSTKKPNPVELPEDKVNGKYFFENSVSPDGRYIAGTGLDSTNGNYNLIISYSFADKSYKKISETGTGPVWLNDSKRILFLDNGKFYIMNATTGNKKFVYDTQKSVPDAWSYTISPDNKWIYFVKQEKESDIWMGYLK
jgi:eukaryotic-like serine/threonine-protein kinase